LCAERDRQARWEGKGDMRARREGECEEKLNEFKTRMNTNGGTNVHMPHVRLQMELKQMNQASTNGHIFCLSQMAREQKFLISQTIK
jgi:hypothetical protein